MSRRDEIQAELDYITAEDEFLKAKAKFQAGNLSAPKYAEVKERFHAARVAWREARETTTADGDAAVAPSTARSSSSVNKG